MCTQSILYKNSRTILYKNSRKILCKNSRLNVLLHGTEKYSNHSNAVNRSTKKVCDEVNFQLVTGKHEIPEGEEFQHINAVSKYVKSIEVAIIFVICFIFACIVYCVVTINVIQNKVDAIQQFVVSSTVYLLLFDHLPQSQNLRNKSDLSTLPDSENGKSCRLSVEVIANTDSKSNCCDKGI